MSSRTALITGAGTGIGLAIARRFAQDGATVVLTGRRKELLDDAAETITAVGGRALVLDGDMSDERTVDHVFETVRGSFGRLDVLINNAAIAGEVGSIWELSLAGWSEALTINLTGPWLCIRAAARLMRPERSGRIVNIGSISGKRPLATRTPYTATKLGLVGLTKTCALELGPYGITVNTISPGAVDTPRLDELARKWNRPRDELVSEISAQSALGRISTPDDIADAAAFLASDQARNVTGVDLTVDAGVWFG